MAKARHPSRFQPGERFGAIPLEVLESEAFRWLPHFARSVLLAMASRYTGLNNGGLELMVKDAESQGINRSQLYAGLGLLVKAGLLRKTVKERCKSGHGKPAKYAITWKPMNEFPAFNLREAKATHTWAEFSTSTPPIRSLTKAEEYLGSRPPRRKVDPTQTLRRRMGRASRETPNESGTPHTKTAVISGAPQTSEPGASHTMKKQRGGFPVTRPCPNPTTRVPGCIDVSGVEVKT